jgi:hypothetical protein
MVWEKYGSNVRYTVGNKEYAGYTFSAVIVLGEWEAVSQPRLWPFIVSIRSRMVESVVDVPIMELNWGTRACVTAAVETERFFQGDKAFSGWTSMVIRDCSFSPALM